MFCCYSKPFDSIWILYFWILSCATRVQIKAIKPPVEISGVDMGRIHQAIAGWANYCMRPTRPTDVAWRVRVLSRPNEERITDAVRLIRRWVSSNFWWRWDYRHTKSLSRYPVPAPVKLLPYGAIEIWLFFFPLLLCLSRNVNRRSKDCFNAKFIVNRFKLGFSFCWAFFLTGCRSDGISFYRDFVLLGFRSDGFSFYWTEASVLGSAVINLFNIWIAKIILP